MILYTTHEIAEILKVNIETVRIKIRSGELKAIKIGNSYRITDESLNNFLKGE